MKWMVRSPKHQITGLFSKEELIQKIQAGEYSAEFEVCAGSHYWFYLSEQRELESQLGISLPAHLLASSASNAEEALGEVTEDFPEESSRTMQAPSSLKPKPAPLAPRPAEPPPVPAKTGPNLIVKLFFILITILVVWAITRS